MHESKCDLHVHSKFSNDPGEWLLKQVGAHESYVEPRFIYDRARERGMQLVTISDHDCIEGARAIEHLEGVFLSSETTVYFPEDGCKVHILVTGVTPEQFAEIDRRRHDLYDFQRYVSENDVIHSVAHPLFQVNDQMTADHVEKLLLLFPRFELINGSRHSRAMEIAEAIFKNLTPGLFTEMARRQGIEPVGDVPWRKYFTGGSDDHGGEYIASAYTRTPAAGGVDGFLANLRTGLHAPGGVHGGSLRLGHSFLSIAREFHKHRFDGDPNNPFAELVERVLHDSDPGGTAFSVPSADASTSDAQRNEQEEAERFPDAAAVFSKARDAAGEYGGSFAEQLFTGLTSFDLDGIAASLAPMLRSALSAAPYVASFHTQHKDEVFLRDIAGRFDAAHDLRRRGQRRLWMTDTFDDVNGVATTIRRLAETAAARDLPLKVATCLEESPETSFPLVNFQPQLTMPIPAYTELTVSLPSMLEVVELIEREKYGQLIISCPGPVGLMGVLAAKLLKLPAYGVYHTDFPRYARMLTGDLRLEQWMWSYIRWFYSGMEGVFVPSNFYRRQLTENGFDPRKLKLLPRGVDTNVFNPSHKRPGMWQEHDLEDRFTFLYVGRVSREKNMELLLDTFGRLVTDGLQANLAVVGDGPIRRELEDRYRGLPIAFTGYLRGDDLAAAYASSDLFVFPSTTDTFGNVVLEAMVSGLPAIVSDKGGPAELVQPNRTGFVVPVDEPGALAETMKRATENAPQLSGMRQRCVEEAGKRSWESVFDTLWTGTSPEAAPTHVPAGMTGIRTQRDDEEHPHTAL